MSYNIPINNTVLISTPYSNPNSEMLKRHQEDKSVNTVNISRTPIDFKIPAKETLSGTSIETIKQEAFIYSPGVLMQAAQATQPNPTTQELEDIQMSDEELKELIDNGAEDITEFNEDLSLPSINGVEPIIDNTVSVVSKDTKTKK